LLLQPSPRRVRPVSRTGGRTSHPLLAAALGLAGASVILLVHFAGGFEHVELDTLDLRFRHCCTAEPAPEVVHIDIDDGSLDAVGRWPWPRERLAEAVGLLHECGARDIALDIILPEPQKVRYVSEATEVYDAPGAAVVHEAPPVPVFDDALLADAIRTAGATVPMHIDLDAPRPSQKPALLPAEASLAEYIASAPPRDREVLRKTYLRLRAQRALRPFALDTTDGGAPSGAMVPPLVTFAAAAGGTGFVTVQPDLDGTVRRIPLLTRAGGGVYPQFALALAVRELGRRHDGCEITAEKGRLTLRGGDGFRRGIPLDDSHNLLITWAPEPKAPPRHLSAAGVLRAARLRNDVERRGRLARVTQLALAQKLNQTDLLALFAEADALYAQRVSSRRARYMAALYDPANIPPEPVDLAGAEAEVEARIDELVAEMREFYLSQPPEDPAARKVFDELKVLDKRLDALGTLNARDEQLIADELARLRRHVEGKVCLIGSTATGAADFVPTPMNPRTPGVVVHANVFNTIISGQFVRAAHPGVGVAIILAAGAAVALVTALARVWLAAVATVLLAAAHTLFSFAGAFGAWHLWLPVAAPLTAMLASFLFVTAYRQLTEERAKRRIRGMFAHALSPALVDELLADPSLAALGGQRRRITCLFSDIRGFTPLSQRLGPQRTVRLLNQYFDRVTDAVQTRGGGYINKFLGDGIFAFFGAPVLQDDHAARALTAAVEYQRRVAALNDALRGDGTGDVSLAVRIGIATGEAMVGNCGSSTRMDYTAIGDCVNLASRLEASNKFFGTRILVAEEAWRAAGGEADYLARPLGEVFVTGQSDGVRVWNVLGPRDEASEADAEACESFARAMERLADPDFAGAVAALESMQAAWPDDRSTTVFLDLARACAGFPPGDDWPAGCRAGDGVVRLAVPWRAPGNEGNS